MAKELKQNNKSGWMGAFDAYKVALRNMKSSPEPLYLFLGLYLVLSIISGIMQSGKGYFSSDYYNLGDILFFVFLLFLFNYSLKVAEGKKVTLNSFLKFDFVKFIYLLVAMILVLLAATVSLLLFILPVIWVGAWLAVTPYALLDKNLGPIEAMKESKRLCSNHKGKVWGIFAVSLLISIASSILGVIPYIGGVAYAFASVWSFVAGALLYRWVKVNAQTTS